MGSSIWTPPVQAVTGHSASSSAYNDLVDDVATYVGLPPGWMLQNVASQAITSTTITAVTMATVVRDTDGYFNIGTSVSAVTVPANLGGVYQIDGYVTFDIGSNGIRWVSLYINGSQLFRFPTNTAPNANPNEFPTVGGSIQWPLNAGDVVELRCFQNSGATKNILGSAPELAIFNGIWRST